MQDYEWKSRYSIVEPGISEARISHLERQLGVLFPPALRQGYLTAEGASIFKDGKSCDTAVTGPVAEGGYYAGSFDYLDPFDQITREVEDLQEYVDDLYERDIPDVIPFSGLGAGGWVCLNYQNDPTRANPEIWQADMETNDSFETFFTKVADSFDHLIEMLVPDDELERLGFRS